MSIDSLILIACSVAASILGLIIYVRNPGQPNNIRFAVLSASMISWTVFNYISDNSDSHVLLFTRLTFIGGILTIYSLANFLLHFPREIDPKNVALAKFHGIFSLIMVPVTMLPWFIESVDITEGHANIATGYLYYLFIFYVVISLGVIISSIRTQYKNSESIAQKNQIRLISNGVLLYAVFALSSNLLIPLVVDDWSVSRFGPAFTLFFLGMIGYAIIKHKLFNVRLIIARAMGYGLAGLIVLTIYISVLFGITQKVFEGADPFITDNIVPIATAIILGLSYPRLKLFFDRLTNRVFYRDAYDPQAFLDELNSTIVGNIELGILLRHTSNVIQKNLKSEHCFIEVNGASAENTRVMGVGTLQLTKEESRFIFGSLERSNRKTLVTDQLSYNDEKLRSLLDEKNIGLITRLVSRQENKTHAIAHLIIGQKKSGNIYDKQDIKIVEIISDELLIAIQNALRFEEIQEFNVTLQAKVNEATAKLQRTNKKLRDLDETKDEFISMASHQLRTPLTSVKGYMSMVLEGDAGKLSKSQKELLEQAFISSQRMVYLIADLLNVSRLKSGKFIIESHPTNLAEVVEGEIKQLRETAKSKGLGFEFKKPKNFPELMLDETKIRQVIMNFSDNSIYYTPSGGNIKIELKEDKNSVYFTVTDTGLGVPKEEKAHLFTKFYRAKNARNARPDGTGLGLFMAKKVVDALGGNIIFESEEGKGSTFGFTFEKRKLKADRPTK